MSDQGIKNDDILYLVFAKEGSGSAGWEDILVENFTSATEAVAEIAAP